LPFSLSDVTHSIVQSCEKYGQQEDEVFICTTKRLPAMVIPVGNAIIPKCTAAVRLPMENKYKEEEAGFSASNPAIPTKSNDPLRTMRGSTGLIT
jgi:hypothetical protein